MLTKLELRNFQSHEDTTIELAPLTVIVGQSSAGKSSIVRALKGLASNLTGKDFITNGATTAQVSATTDRGVITLTKGKPEDSYVILPSDDINNPRRYTKLGGTVPPDVTEFLGIEPKNAINFADQFDMPFLLKTSASEVARILGELTNVSAIFNASREGLRRKTAASTTLKTREADLASLAPKLATYEDLPARRASLAEAGEHIRAAHNAQTRLSALDDLLVTLRTATNALRAAQDNLAPLPDVSALLDAANRRAALNDIIISLSSATGKAKNAVAAIGALDEEIENLTEEYDAALREAGTCPTCHQSTEGVHHHG